MNDKQRKIISEHIYDYLIISADVPFSLTMTESASEIKLFHGEDPVLYQRITDYAMKYGEDLQSLICNEHYDFLSCFVYDVKHFRDTFSDTKMIGNLFYNVNIEEAIEVIINFPVKIRSN
ncbi:hypothetical protein SD767_004186 [Salmonella enterica]|nr:hypothetical protein [Salmonella enterica]